MVCPGLIFVAKQSSCSSLPWATAVGRIQQRQMPYTLVFGNQEVLSLYDQPAICLGGHGVAYCSG
jgi:hypothetical protein